MKSRRQISLPDDFANDPIDPGAPAFGGFSRYRDNIGHYVPHGVIDLALDAAAAWTPAEVFCLDIALSDGRYGIVEANCFNASRFYGADAMAVLAAVSEHVVKERNISLG